jgi:hypothetical protein
MRVVLAASIIGAFALFAGPAFAQQDNQASAPPETTQGQLDNATDDQPPAPDTFPDSTKIPEPSESGQQIDSAPTDTAQTDDGDQPH